MSYWYKATNVREYVVALNSEYNVSIKNEDQMPWEAEDQAYDIIEEVLKQNDVDEYDIYTAMEMETFGGYIIKVRVNLVVPAVATDYDHQTCQHLCPPSPPFPQVRGGDPPG